MFILWQVAEAVKKLIAVQVCTSATSASTFATKSLKKNSANPPRFPSTIFQAHEKFRSFSMSMWSAKTTQRRFCRSRCTTITGVFNISSRRLASGAGRGRTDEVECVAPRAHRLRQTHLAQTLARMLNVPFAVQMRQRSPRRVTSGRRREHFAETVASRRL